VADDDDDERRGDHLEKDLRGRARLIGLLVVLVVLVWFALSNRREVKVDFLVVDAKVRLVYALVFAAALGALADRFTVFRNRRR
jgi:uncharacterized integral membrane protein